MAKYIYTKFREWEIKSDFGQKIYQRHIDLMHPLALKRQYQSCELEFDSILDSIKSNFNPNLFPISIDPLGRIMKGSHVIAGCLFYNKDVYVASEKGSNSANEYPLDYFEKEGLEENYLDAMALQYCELNKNTYIVSIFPSAVGYEEEAENILKEHGNIVYKRKNFFTSVGGFNFILHAYDDESLGQNYSAAHWKAEMCFPEQLIKVNPLRGYLFECSSLEEVRVCKARIRQLYNIEHHSVHINDTHQQAILLATLFFNKNSMDFINNKKESFTPNFDKYFKEYRKVLESTENPREWFIIDGSAVLAAYGLRDCNDLDYIHFGNDLLSPEIQGIDDHNHELIHHAFSKDEIIFDPDNHFFYKGIKFCSLEIIKSMKKNRNESKDQIDVELIQKIIK